MVRKAFKLGERLTVPEGFWVNAFYKKNRYLEERLKESKSVEHLGHLKEHFRLTGDSF